MYTEQEGGICPSASADFRAGRGACSLSLLLNLRSSSSLADTLICVVVVAVVRIQLLSTGHSITHLFHPQN